MRPKIYLGVAGAHILIICAVLFASVLPSCSRKPKPEPIAVDLQQTTMADTEQQTKATAETNTEQSADSTDAAETSQDSDSSAASETVPEDTQSQESSESTTNESWQARSVDDIRKNANMKPVEDRQEPSRNPDVELDSSKLKTKLTEELSDQSLELTVADNTDKSESSKQTRQYYERLTRFLYAKWEQPAAGALNREAPRMKIQLKIDVQGNLLTWKTLKSSRDTRMNVSVKNMLKNLDKVPGFSSYGVDRDNLTLDVVFELD